MPSNSSGRSKLDRAIYGNGSGGVSTTGTQAQEDEHFREMQAEQRRITREAFAFEERVRQQEHEHKLKLIGGR